VSRTEAFDYLVVGAGFAGAVTAERLAATMNQRVLVVDRRDHIAGNAHDTVNEHGLLVHLYGPHIFHTNSDEVFEYLSRFTAWRPYEHRVRALVDGKLVPIPINLETLRLLYGFELTPDSMADFLAARAEHVPFVRTSEDVVVSRVGRELYEKFFQGYTRKQWGLDPSELDATVAGRIPTRTNLDDRYFTDKYQALPADGYTRMFERILDHPNIEVQLCTEFDAVRDGARNIVFTGPIDEFFQYRFGRLPYRSIDFRFESHHTAQYQPTGTINYPNDHEYTRITEFKHLTGQTSSITTICYEYPRDDGDPYYPVPRPENAVTYEKYRQLATTLRNVHFVGRLATYKYYNMDQVVAQALALARRLSCGDSAHSPL
jgi:UDP-galactopyranose mutase